MPKTEWFEALASQRQKRWTIPPAVSTSTRDAGAVVILPAYPETDEVFKHYLLSTQVELDNLGIADATVFDSQLQKTG